jgi:hypothetical protein
MLAFLLPFACTAHAAQTDVLPKPAGKWQVRAAPIGDATLALTLKAEKEVRGWMKSAVPALTIECGKKKAAVYVETWLPLEVTQMDKQIVRVQLDGGRPIPQRWQELTNAAMGASARDSAVLLKQFIQSRKLIFQFTPFNSPPAHAEFDISGLDGLAPQLAQTCWE